MNRVEVTHAFMNIYTMQVCAEADATDEEILKVCNSQNPAGTSNGWGTVVREPSGTLTQPKSAAPIACDQSDGRMHFLVLC